MFRSLLLSQLLASCGPPTAIVPADDEKRDKVVQRVGHNGNQQIGLGRERHQGRQIQSHDSRQPGVHGRNRVGQPKQNVGDHDGKRGIDVPGKLVNQPAKQHLLAHACQQCQKQDVNQATAVEHRPQNLQQKLADLPQTTAARQESGCQKQQQRTGGHNSHPPAFLRPLQFRRGVHVDQPAEGKGHHQHATFEQASSDQKLRDGERAGRFRVIGHTCSVG